MSNSTLSIPWTESNIVKLRVEMKIIAIVTIVALACLVSISVNIIISLIFYIFVFITNRLIIKSCLKYLKKESRSEGSGMSSKSSANQGAKETGGKIPVKNERKEFIYFDKTLD